VARTSGGVRRGLDWLVVGCLWLRGERNFRLVKALGICEDDAKRSVWSG
jgi:hypothetical protein